VSYASCVAQDASIGIASMLPMDQEGDTEIPCRWRKIGFVLAENPQALVPGPGCSYLLVGREDSGYQTCIISTCSTGYGIRILLLQSLLPTSIKVEIWVPGTVYRALASTARLQHGPYQRGGAFPAPSLSELLPDRPSTS